MTADDLADYLRVTATEAASAMRYAHVAGQELERYAAVALLSQTIVAETLETGSTVLSLPIRPIQAGETITVELAAEDGSTTTTADWHLRDGQHPVIHLDKAPDQPVRVTYVAGYGSTTADIPSDLQHATLDQALGLYDLRGDTEAPATGAPALARIAGGWRSAADHGRRDTRSHRTGRSGPL